MLKWLTITPIAPNKYHNHSQESINSFFFKKIDTINNKYKVIDTLIKLGANQLIIAGGGGGRFDHQLALFRLFEKEQKLRAWLTKSEEMIVIKESSKFLGHKNSTISFFPLTDFVQINSSIGLRWSLEGLCLNRGQASVSNVITDTLCRVSLKSGRLLMIRNLNNVEVL